MQLRSQRDEASANLEFEDAAALHSQVQRAEVVRALAPELVRPLSQLRAIVLQASAQPDEVAVFLFDQGRLRGPAAFSTLGMRIQNEQSGSSSLYAQPMALEPVPESGTAAEPVGSQSPEVIFRAKRGVLEARLESTLAGLGSSTDSQSAANRQGHLALLKRWYYRPEVRRPGEIFFPDEQGLWPLKAILRGIGRVAAKALPAGAVS